MATKPKSPARQSKGKQHPLKAESLDQLADALESDGQGPSLITRAQLADLLRAETKRVRSILR